MCWWKLSHEHHSIIVSTIQSFFPAICKYVPRNGISSIFLAIQDIQSDISNRVHVWENTFCTNQVVSVGVSTWRRWNGWLDDLAATVLWLWGCWWDCVMFPDDKETTNMTFFQHFYYIPFRFFVNERRNMLFFYVYTLFYEHISSLSYHMKWCTL